MPDEIKNYGLLPDDRSALEKAGDYEFGGITNILPEILVSDGQWLPYIPSYEYQNTNFETMSCVTFAELNALEIIVKRKYGGEINNSDRFTAKKSGTTREGNSFYRVAESIRKNNGVVPQLVWPNMGLNWTEYYSDIPNEVTLEGVKSLNKYFIQYEFISEPLYPIKLMEALMYAPLVIGIYAYGPLVNGVYQKPNKTPNHAVTLIGYKEGEYWIILDHYLGGEVKHLAWDYPFSAALKLNIIKKHMFRKEIGKPSIYMIVNNQKILIVDMPTLNAVADSDYEEVASLEQYPSNGTLVWLSREID